MHILCSYSGIKFQVEHFPFTLEAREAVHPVFEIPQKKLLSLTRKWSAGEFTPTDSYLYFLSILNSSDLIHWHCAVKRTPFTDSLIAQNMEGLIRAVIKLNSTPSPESCFPSFAITRDSCTLSNIKEWIESWETAYSDYKSGYRSAYDSKKLLTREAALQRMIKNPNSPPAKIAPQIADWAAVAGSFPTFLMDSPFQRGMKISLSDYWKTLIVRCCKNENIFSLNSRDLNELLTHCAENIPLGSIYSSTLFQVLRKAITKNSDFLGIESLGSYTLLDPSASVEVANMQAIINSAPLEEPLRENYPSSFKFLQAKLRYEAAKKAGLRDDLA